MMISPTELYFLLKLDTMRGFELGIAIAMVVIAVISVVVPVLDSDVKIRKRWFIGPGIISIILFLIYAATPSTKEMLAINIIPKVVNSEIVQKDIPEEAKEVYAALKKWLIEQATEVTVTGTEFDEKSVQSMKGYQLRKLMEETIRKEFEAERKRSNH